LIGNSFARTLSTEVDQVRADELWLGRRLGRLHGHEVEAHVVLLLRRSGMDEGTVALHVPFLPGEAVDGEGAIAVDLEDTRLRVVLDAADLAERSGLGVAVVADDHAADEAGVLEVEGGGHGRPDVLVLGRGGR